VDFLHPTNIPDPGVQRLEWLRQIDGVLRVQKKQGAQRPAAS